MKALTVTLIMVGFFVSNAQAMDKELTSKIIQNAITTIIVDKQSSEVADGVIIDIHKVFTPLVHGLSEKGKYCTDWNTGKTSIDAPKFTPVKMIQEAQRWDEELEFPVVTEEEDGSYASMGRKEGLRWQTNKLNQ